MKRSVPKFLRAFYRVASKKDGDYLGDVSKRDMGHYH